MPGAGGVVVEDALEFYEKLTGKIAIEALTPGALILGKGFRHDGIGQAVTRFISTLISIIGLILLAPLLAAIALAIKIDSRGPVFFVQQRVGKAGRLFPLFKLRSMRAGAGGPGVTGKGDPRITAVGRVLRKISWWLSGTVFRGEMNLIGPRPHPTSNQEIFERNIAYYRLRSTVRPGVTGWAQVRYGYANNLEQETEKMRYDLYYIKNRTLWLDVRILLETIWTILTGHGAAEVRRRTRRAQAHAWRAASADAVGPVTPAYWPLLAATNSTTASKPLVRQ